MKAHLTLMLLAAGALVAAADSTIHVAHRYGYGANVGWIDWRADGANGAVIGSTVCSGYIYAANLGWIHLGDGTAADNVRYQNNSATDYGVNHDGAGNLTGYAYGANFGWINFGQDYPAGTARPTVDLASGALGGWIYGANIGWISLSNAQAFVQTEMILRVDSDGDGLDDTWERAHAGNLDAMNAATDSDGDGVPDRDEYVADTDPFMAGDGLRITEILCDRGLREVRLTWTSRPTRVYRIHGLLAFDADNLWQGLWRVPGDAGATTSFRFLDWAGDLGGQDFFRIEALLPLAP